MLPPKNTVTVETVKGRHRYSTPLGDFWGATTFLDMDGSKTPGLIAWAAKRERDAAGEAAVKNAGQGSWNYEEGMKAYRERLLASLPEEREHVRALDQAGDVGSEVHDAVEKITAGGAPTMLSDGAARSMDLWVPWWQNSGYKVIATEQPVWHESGYAGTIDAVLEKDGETEIVDYKSGSGIYFSHHLQLAAYLYAARTFIPVHRAKIVHIPTKPGGKLKVVELGQLNGKRRIENHDLFKAFTGLKEAWGVLNERAN